MRAQENRARHRSAGPTEEPPSADGQPSVKKEPKKEGHDEGPADLLRCFYYGYNRGLRYHCDKVITISIAAIAIATTHNIHRSQNRHYCKHVFNVIVSQYIFAHHNSHFYLQPTKPFSSLVRIEISSTITHIVRLS